VTPLFWLGDQLTSWDAEDGMASSVTALLSASLSGAGLTHSDIGGYTAVQLGSINITRSKELFMRWAELSAFTFAMRTHLGSMPAPSWQLTGDAETIQHFFSMVRLFQSLSAYRLQVSSNASEAGLPPFQAMAMAFPGSADWGLTSQFMLGSRLLVAPVLQPAAASVRVFLPAGTEWQHVSNSSMKLQGQGSFVQLPAPLGQPCALWLL
jgi:alpha-glucosidase